MNNFADEMRRQRYLDAVESLYAMLAPYLDARFQIPHQQWYLRILLDGAVSPAIPCYVIGGVKCDSIGSDETPDAIIALSSPEDINCFEYTEELASAAADAFYTAMAYHATWKAGM